MTALLINSIDDCLGQPFDINGGRLKKGAGTKASRPAGCTSSALFVFMPMPRVGDCDARTEHISNLKKNLMRHVNKYHVTLSRMHTKFVHSFAQKPSYKTSDI